MGGLPDVDGRVDLEHRDDRRREIVQIGHTLHHQLQKRFAGTIDRLTVYIKYSSCPGTKLGQAAGGVMTASILRPVPVEERVEAQCRSSLAVDSRH
jgi:hypothetical protein